jgi:hypothetical protein
MRGRAFQEILDELDSIIPCDWDRIVFSAEDEKSSYTYEFFIRSNGKYTQCYKIPGIKRDRLSDSFRSIRKIIVSAREKSDSWNEMTLCIDADGHFKADFASVDYSEGSTGHWNNWKQRYLI